MALDLTPEQPANSTFDPKALASTLGPYLVAVLAAFAAVGLLIGLMGFDVLRAYSTILFTSFRTPNGFIQTLLKFVPLLLQALAFTVPLAAGKFNIGGEGQLLVGAIGATAVGIVFAELPLLILLPLVILAGVLCGAMWAAIPAWLLYQFNMNEILTTVLLNFVSFSLVDYVATAIWRDPAAGHPTTVPIGPGGELPRLIASPPLHSGLILALLVAVAVYIYTNKTSAGYELIATGANPRAAGVYGIPVRRVFILSLVIGGALAGLSGAIEVAGNHHRLIEGMQSNFLLLGIIGVIIVILGIFLVYNSVSAIVYQQVNQIGIMKAIGASAWQVIWSYLVLILGYGTLAAVISIPIGAVAAFGLQSFFANFLNLEISGISVDPIAVIVQVAICLVAPLFAALVPLGGGMRITVREAISTYGISGSAGLVDRLVAKARTIPYTLLLTIGNTFRNRRRVLVVQVSLVMAGIIFMMVMGVNDATRYTFGEKLASIHNYQITLALEKPARVQEIENTAQSLAEVTAVESWLVLPASARPESQPEKEVTDARITIFGQPAETSLYRPELQAGRWLRPDDVNAAVVGLQVSDDKGWQVGDWLTLADNDDRELNVQVVGILFDPINDSSVHLPLSTLQREWNRFGQANTVWVQTRAIDVDTQTAAAMTLEQAFERRSIEIAPSSTFGENTIAGIIEQNGQRNNIIIRLLAVMAVVIALVGGVGLSGVISLSVLERRREIGVMRAIGASSWQVIRLFLGEGILLGLISWLIAWPLSIPAAYGLSTQGLSLALNQQLSYNFTPNGALLWLMIIIMLAVIASLLPARKAALVSVRESLAYQ